MGKIFYQPKGAWLGDVIPYVENDIFYLFYLNDCRINGVLTDETDWNLLKTTDFITFEELGTVLPHGEKDEIDNSCYTGSVIKNRGRYHIFYTSNNNSDERFKSEGRPVQTILHATSDDLIHWAKHLDQGFGADLSRYEIWDWRDPFVYYCNRKQCWRMLLTAREKDS